MKNKSALQQWEEFEIVQKENMSPWNATTNSRICSSHFKQTDYITPPSTSTRCRLKSNALPSIFPTYEVREPSIALQSKRPLSSVDNTMCLPAKAAKPASEGDERDEFEQKLRNKIKSLQQQLRRSKEKAKSMGEVIEALKKKLNLNADDVESFQSTVDNLSTNLLLNIKGNLNTMPSARRYTDEIKEFALTVYYYSPRAYRYIRSIIPLPNPSMVRRWSSSLQCEPGFIKEAFISLAQEVTNFPIKKDCCLIIDAMAIRSQTVWTPQCDKYFGFVDYGPEISNPADKLATEALVFLLVGTRSNWKCPIGYFLGDKTNAEIQSKLISKALVLAAEAGLKVWSVTADGTAVNLRTFELLGCKFIANYDEMVTSFKHPITREEVFVILDPCHMLKLARNALEAYNSFVDGDGNVIEWQHIRELQKLQENEGLTLANKLSNQHIQFQKHKMNVRLAAQTLSSSVANAIEFLDNALKLSAFRNSNGIVGFIRTIDKLFDMLNSRNPLGNGYKTPLKLENRSTWEVIFTSSAHYLLSLKTNETPPQLLSMSKRKTFIIGFVACIKSTISMATEMFSIPKPFKYLLTYKFSQDHIELLFSCIRSRGGWNNNPNCLQMKYALRKMMMRNAITASQNANCVDFTGSNGIIPVFHKRKHNSDDSQAEITTVQENSPEINHMLEHLDQEQHSEFVSNVLYYIAGYIVSQMINKISCAECKRCLISSPTDTTAPHNCSATRYHEAGQASAFTNFINNGGLKIPSSSVYQTVEYCEHVFRAIVSGRDGNQISSLTNLKERMIIQVNKHFVLDTPTMLFLDHEDGANENLVEDDHKVKLVKGTANKFFTLRLFTYGKKYEKKVIRNGKQSDRHRLNKLVLFNNE